jgi:hypothetical protein
MKLKSFDADRMWPTLIASAFFILYAATAMPGLGWRDAPEFAASAHVLGISHPAGYPTYSIFTKIFTLLPLGSIPFRITLAAAFYQAVTLYLLFYLIVYLLGRKNEEPGTTNPITLLAAGLVTVIFGLLPVVWTNATGIEVYGLNLMFLALILTCAVKWKSSDRAYWLYAGGLIYGLSAGNHATVAFFLPGLILLVLVQERDHRLRRLLFLSFFFLVGFSVYLYLPIRAQAGPAFDFGFPINWERFWAHISDRKDAETHFRAARESSLFWFYVSTFIRKTIPNAFWFLGLPFLIIGFRRIWRWSWAFALAVFLIALVNVVFFIEWPESVAFLPTWFIAFLLMGVGLGFITQRWSVLANAAPRLRLWIGAACAIVVTLIVAVEYPDQNRSTSFLSTEAFRDDFESLPPDAISLVTILPFHQRAYQGIFRLRPDVTVIMMSEFVMPDAFKPVFPSRFPLVRVPPEPYSRETGVDYLKKIITANLDDKRDIFWQPNNLDEVFHTHLKPALGMLFEFSPKLVKELSDAETQALTNRLTDKIRQEIKEDGFIVDPGLHDYYSDTFLNTSSYLRLKGRPKDALALVLTMQRLLGPEGTNSLPVNDRAVMHSQLGAIFWEMGYLKKAEEQFRKSISLVPHYNLPWAALGRVLLDLQRPKEALDALKRAEELDPTSPETIFYFGEYYRATGQMDKAKEYYLKALNLAQRTTLANNIREAYRKHFDEPGGGS